MLKFAKTILSKPVLLNQERALVGVVEDIVVDPADGRVVGILVREGFGKKHIKAVAEKDILAISDKFVLIPGYEAVGDIEEIVRVAVIVNKKIQIIGNKVVTVAGNNLGRVNDFSIDTVSGILAKVYVEPNIFSLGVLAGSHIIDRKQIISIEKDKIIVEDTSLKATSKSKKAISEIEPA